MHAFLYRVGWFCARRHWIVIGAWIVILAALLLLRNAFGGTYTNNYTVPGSNSQQGTDLLEKEFPNQSMYSGQIVFASPKGKTVADQTDAVNTSVTNISKLPDILSATSPFASGELVRGIARPARSRTPPSTSTSRRTHWTRRT